MSKIRRDWRRQGSPVDTTPRDPAPPRAHKIHGASLLLGAPTAKDGRVACGLAARRKDVPWDRDRSKVTCAACLAKIEEEEQTLHLRAGTGTVAPAALPPAATADVETARAELVAAIEGLSRSELIALRDTARMFKARRGR